MDDKIYIRKIDTSIPQGDDTVIKRYYIAVWMSGEWVLFLSSYDKPERDVYFDSWLDGALTLPTRKTRIIFPEEPPPNLYDHYAGERSGIQ